MEGKDTNIIIYCVFVRNHGEHSLFTDVENDLPRLASMGVDYIWLLPIYPIGSTRRKGTLGSPYSISDYRGINPEHGTIGDFSRLIAKAHELHIGIIIDIVFNHTSYDHNYIAQHPEWYTRDQSGNPIARVPAWSDIIDLKHSGSAFSKHNSTLKTEISKELWDELVDVLIFWAKQGVDGFRCDVAGFVPIDFWKTAKRVLAEIWIGETWLTKYFERDRKASIMEGLPFSSYADFHQAFDITYDYDTYTAWRAVLEEKIDVKTYLELLRTQNLMLPGNATKMRFVENHDKPRVMSLTKTKQQAVAWTAFSVFNEGAFLIYGGMESECSKLPSLFELDLIDWGDYPLQKLYTQLIHIKHKIPRHAALTFIEHSPAIIACWEVPRSSEGYVGIFNVKGIAGNVTVQLRNGKYVDAITEDKVTVKGNTIPLPESFLILRFSNGELGNIAPFNSHLFGSV